MALSRLISVVCLLLACLPLAAVDAAERLVSVIMVEDLSRYRSIHQVFSRNLINGKETRVWVHTPAEDDLSLRNSAHKALEGGSDVIVTYGAAATAAALAATTATPVVYADVADPLVQGFIPGPTTPGENVTGIRGDAPVQTLLKHMRTVTGATRLAAVYPGNDRAAANQVETLRRIAVKNGWEVLPVALNGPISPREMLDRVPQEAEVLYCSCSNELLRGAPQWIPLAMERQLPVISLAPGLAEQGAFMVLESDPAEQGEVLAGYINRLLTGSRPQDLPPEHPRRVSLVVNLKAAGQLGIRVPFEVLAATGRLIR